MSSVHFSRFVFGAAVALLLAACSGANTSSPSGVVPSLDNSPAPVLPAANVMQSCATLLPGDDMRCDAEFRTDVAPPGRENTEAVSAPPGYGPSAIQSAYKLPASTGGRGQTVAIVDAYDDPNAAKDLAVYRSRFALAACTTATGCFRKVGQTGSATALPAANAGWAQEISLDLDMVSATCPNCHILLVEAASASSTNLAAAVNEAVHLGATEVSNSYGGAEYVASYSAYSHPGVIITASSGDSGYGAHQPCSYSTVVCVGGTTLKRSAAARGWSETAWSGSGSGCSAYVAKPSWQTDRLCHKRSEADVSAVADPNTGVAVYDSVSANGFSGWLVFGGTSASSPIVASVYALAGNARSLVAAQSVWKHLDTTALNDVVSGSNGTCSIAYICHAGKGYDGPTGAGTPNGTAAF